MTKIKVFNYDQQETVNFSLIMISGGVEPNDCHHIICFTKSGPRITWPVQNGCFKCLVILERGENSVTLSCNGTQVTLRLNFIPRSTDLCVTPLYIICDGEDGCFKIHADHSYAIDDALQRISFVMQLVQCIFAEKLRESGYGRKCFQLENDINNSAPLCQVFRSKISISKAKSLGQEELWEVLAREIMLSEIGNMKRSLGGVIHECGHIFDLGHPGEGIMGRGFENVGKVFCPILRSRMSSSNPSFSLVPQLKAHQFPDSQDKKVGEGNCKEYSKPSELKVNLCEEESEDDMTHWSPGCAAILANHRWFNNFDEVEALIEFDPLRNIVRSPYGLKVVQLRGEKGAVRRSWQWGEVRKDFLILPKLNGPTDLFAIDALGTTLNSPLW